MTRERRKSDNPGKGESRIRVLAVDDDRSYLNLLRLLLKREGFEIEVAMDGRSAIERVRAGHDIDIDLLLIDLAMPGLDGIDTVKELRADKQSTLYTILLTAHDGTDVKLRALDSGLDDFLSKSASASEIVAKVRSAARRLEMERRLYTENAELQTLALTDELTGIANRRALFSAGETMLAAGRRLSAIILDVDQFKQINDLHGHLAGDRVLASIAQCLKETTRVGDLIARYGGDEFVVLLPDTGERESRTIARRIGRAIAGLEWHSTPASVTFRVTATIGVSVATTRAPSKVDELLNRADAELLRAKKNAREKANATASPPPRRRRQAAQEARIE